MYGRWHHEADHIGNNMVIGEHRISCTQNKTIAETDWSDCDVVIEASGKMKTKTVLQAYLGQGVKRVVVSAPIKDRQCFESTSIGSSVFIRINIYPVLY